MGSNDGNKSGGLEKDEYYIRESGLIVTATRIGATGEVSLNNGHTSRAYAGDWLVMYPNGHVRTVSSAAFNMMYAK